MFELEKELQQAAANAEKQAYNDFRLAHLANTTQIEAESAEEKTNKQFQTLLVGHQFRFLGNSAQSARHEEQNQHADEQRSFEI